MIGSKRLFGLRLGSTRHAPEQAARFHEKVMPHMDAAYNYARYLTRDPAIAEDVAQEALLRAFRSIGGFRGDAGKAWLLAIVRNCYFDQTGADRRQQDIAGTNDADLVISPVNDPESALLERSSMARVRAAVDSLPDPFRETLVLREFEEFSYREIAGLIGAPVGTIMSRLARARHMLAAMLLDENSAEGGTQ